MTEENFYIGQIFSPEYPPEAADYCNSHGDRYITELDPDESGQRRFQIVAVPEPTIEEVQEMKRMELESAFMRWYEKEATCTSSLGFVVDSDARAMMDTTGLVTTLETEPDRSTVAFMDHNNVPHLLTLDQMKTVQLEIIQNGQSAYAQKWTFRNAIDEATDAKELMDLEIIFKGEDFSAAS